MQQPQLILGDCVPYLKTLPDNSIDVVISDTPYPGIKRDYGTLTESEWHGMMFEIMTQARRILKTSGSTLWIIQPNSEFIGKMRLWTFEFILEWGKKWNLVQDLYWMNYIMLPSAGATSGGLCRGCLKNLVWFGNPDCYRNQDAILWSESEEGALQRASKRCERIDKHTSPSGYARDRMKVHAAAEKRGGVTPFNVWPIANNRRETKHPASTPYILCEKLVSYLCPPGGTVLDPFMGSGTIGEAAIKTGRQYIGVEKEIEYWEMAKTRLLNVNKEPNLLE